MSTNPDWLGFSPLEHQILDWLNQHEPASAKEISGGIGKSASKPSSSLCIILANLVSRKVLIQTPHGYRINWPDDGYPRVIVEDSETKSSSP